MMMEDIKNLKKIASSLDKLQKALVYLIYLKNNEAIKGRTMMQKEMFLVAKLIPEVWETADFVSYNHGAYSEYIDISLEDLKSYEVINEEDSKIVLTKFGEEIAKVIENSFSGEEKDAILEFKDFLNQMTLDEALVYSYFSFPEFTKDSAIIERVKLNRIKASASLYKRGLINLEKAIFLSGLAGKEFLRRY